MLGKVVLPTGRLDSPELQDVVKTEVGLRFKDHCINEMDVQSLPPDTSRHSPLFACDWVVHCLMAGCVLGD